MAEGDIQPVLRCRHCNKPFDKQSTFRRHGYYCRSLKGISTPRTRSCISCSRRKVRCDNRQPVCSGCASKGSDCHYPASASKSVEPSGKGPRPRSLLDPKANQQPTTASPIPNPSSPPSLSERTQARNHDGLALPTPTQSAISENGHTTWDWSNPVIDVFDIPDLALLSDSAVPFWQFQPTIPPSQIPLPKQPTYLFGSLIQRSRPHAGLQRTASLIVQTLKSYPLMLVRPNTLPPFIHPHLVRRDAENSDMEPLNNCISLLHMITSGVQGSRKLFWRNVRTECERFLEEYQQWNRWQTLAGLQALSVYLIVWVDEGQTGHDNLDVLLVTAVAAISIHHGRLKMASDSGPATTWEDWIYEESKRRLCVIYQIINLLVYFEPIAMCDMAHADLAIAPLPAKKQLWEAIDELGWKAETERDGVGATADFALTATGGLVRLDEGQDQLQCASDGGQGHKQLNTAAVSRTNASWDEWCSGMDSLGGLVMLAASLTV